MPKDKARWRWADVDRALSPSSAVTNDAAPQKKASREAQMIEAAKNFRNYGRGKKPLGAEIRSALINPSEKDLKELGSIYREIGLRLRIERKPG